jgi:hypothetical protein
MQAEIPAYPSRVLLSTCCCEGSLRKLWPLSSSVESLARLKQLQGTVWISLHTQLPSGWSLTSLLPAGVGEGEGWGGGPLTTWLTSSSSWIIPLVLSCGQAGITVFYKHWVSLCQVSIGFQV